MPKAKKKAKAPGAARTSTPRASGRPAAKLKWKWVNSALAAAIAAAVAGAVVTHWLNRPAAAHTAAASPQLQVDDIEITPKTIEKSGSLPAFLDQAYFSLRNTGNQLAIITGVKLEVEKFAQLPECYSAGSLGTTGWSSVSLPADPNRGAVVTVPESQQIAPDSADKFEVSLHIAKAARGLQVYRLQAWVLYDNQVPLNAGDLIVSLPVEPEDGGYFWSRTDQADPNSLKPFVSDVKALSQCLISNSNSLHSILSLPGARSAGLSSLKSVLAYHY